MTRSIALLCALIAWAGFFGLTNAPGTSVTIVNPEPGTAALLALGLLQLAVSRGSMRRK